MDVKRRMNHQNVLDQLTELFVDRGVPDYIRSDNGPEFTAQAVRDWLKAVGVKTLYIELAQSLGERICGEFQREVAGRAAQPRSLRHVVGGEGVGREMAQGV